MVGPAEVNQANGNKRVGARTRESTPIEAIGGFSPRPAPEDTGIGWVYFASAPAVRAMKIGYARDYTKRLLDLQTASPVAIEPHYAVRGTRELERGLHAKFKGIRLRAEWYRDCDLLAEFFEALDDLKIKQIGLDPDETVIAEDRICCRRALVSPNDYWDALIPTDKILALA